MKYVLLSQNRDVLCEGLLVEECLMYYEQNVDDIHVHNAFNKYSNFGKQIVFDYGCTIRQVINNTYYHTTKHRVVNTTTKEVLYEGLLDECFIYWYQNYRFVDEPISIR